MPKAQTTIRDILEWQSETEAELEKGRMELQCLRKESRSWPGDIYMSVKVTEKLKEVGSAHKQRDEKADHTYLP